MLDINKINEGNTLTCKLTGKIDTKTAPELEKSLSDLPASTAKLILDFEDVAYISSAGLRVLLKLSTLMENRKGEMKVRNANEEIIEIFEVTGFDELLPIEY